MRTKKCSTYITKAQNLWNHKIRNFFLCSCVQIPIIYIYMHIIDVILTKYVYFPSIRRINIDCLRLATIGFAAVSVVNGIRFAALCSAAQGVVRVFDRWSKCQNTRSYVTIRTGLLDKIKLYFLVVLSRYSKKVSTINKFSIDVIIALIVYNIHQIWRGTARLRFSDIFSNIFWLTVGLGR